MSTTTNTKATTPSGVLSYPHLDKPQPGEDGKADKYSCTIVFTPADLATEDGKKRFAELRAAALSAARKTFGSTLQYGQKTVTIEEALDRNVGLHWPFRTDVEAKGYPEGSVFINVRSTSQPGVVYAHAGEDGRPAKMDPANIREQMYPGARVRATVAAFGYTHKAKKGVSFGLNNLQKLGEGDRLDSRRRAEDEFDADLSAAPADLAELA